MNRLLVAAAVAVLLSACSSTKLDKAPVEDKSGTSVNKGTGAADPNAVGERNVETVEVGNANADAMQMANRVVYFDYDSYVIKPEFQSIIEKHAKILKTDKSKKVALEGHTDERGGREYNLALGQKRAEAVRRALGLLGVSDNQMEATSFGKEKPAVQGSTEEAMAKNRRVEITYR